MESKEEITTFKGAIKEILIGIVVLFIGLVWLILEYNSFSTAKFNKVFPYMLLIIGIGVLMILYGLVSMLVILKRRINNKKCEKDMKN